MSLDNVLPQDRSHVLGVLNLIGDLRAGGLKRGVFTEAGSDLFACSKQDRRVA